MAVNGDSDHSRTGKGLALTGLIVGLLTGAAVYGIVEYWIDDNDTAPLPYTVLFFTITAAAAYLLLAETHRIFKAAIAAVIIAALLILPDFFMAGVAGNETRNLSSFPPIFWFVVSRWIVVFLLVTLTKAGLEKGWPAPYREVFFHGLTIPLIAGGAKLFAVLALVLLFAWARLLKELDVNFFNELFQEPWFIFPFLGAIGGLSIALMRGQQSVLGALRFIVLLLARILIIITALATITFAIVIATKGTAPIFELWRPSGIMLGLALAGMLIFNGVYQDGIDEPPRLWLRAPTLITLIGFPLYAALAFIAFWMRVDEYGLTPARIAGLAVNGLAAAYSVVCLAGLLTELNWGGRRWMPLVAPLNTLMAILWIVVLTALATPLLNPWAMSANSQYARIANERVPADEFDYGYMRFELGEYGDRALDKMLTLSSHPEAQAIREGVERARSAKNYWEYQHPEFAAPLEEPDIDTTASEPAPAADDGPMFLEINPEGADTGPDDPDRVQDEEALTEEEESVPEDG